MKKIIWIIGIVLLGFTANAQSDADIWELAKTDLKTGYKDIIIQNMNFSEDEAGLFWPIFNEYMQKKDKTMDEFMNILKEYAGTYETMSDEKADELVKAVNNTKMAREKNRIAYYKKLKKALGAKKAAKLYQIDGVINTLFDFQIVSEIPILE